MSEKSIKEELEEQKQEIEIKITLTENGYRLETSVPMVAEYLMSSLDSVQKDLFVQHLYSRPDSPWMRKIEKPKRGG